MLRYLMLNVAVIAAVALWLRRLAQPRRRLIIIVGVMVVLTAVFDNIIIGLDIVRYVPGHWSGLGIGRAPLEDFAYALVAAVLMPTLWQRKVSK